MKQLRERQAGKGHEAHGGQLRGQPLVVASQPTEACGAGEAALHRPAGRQQDEEAVLGLGQRDDFELDAVGGSRGGLRASAALVDIGQPDGVAGDVLDPRGQHLDLRPILSVGGRDLQRQQMGQRVHRGVDFGPFAPLMSVVAAAPGATALGRTLQSVAVQDRRRELVLALGRALQQHVQFGDDRLETASHHPAAGPLVDYLPRRHVVGHHAPAPAYMM